MDFEEKLYAVGRIPGSFMRREGRPLCARRAGQPPHRPAHAPLFPSDLRNDVCITCTVMSVDRDCSPEVTAMIGASAMVAISDIPWNGPIGCCEVGYVDGKIVINPTQAQRAVSQMDTTVASTGEKVVMIEAGAKEIPDEIMFEGIKAAHEVNKTIVALINKMVEESGKPKFTYQHADFNQELFDKIVEATMDEAKAAMDTDDKNVREARWNQPSSKSGTSCSWRTIPRWTSIWRDHLQVPEEDRQGLAAGGPPGGRPPEKRDPAPGRRGGACCPGSTAPACLPAARPRCCPTCHPEHLSASQKLDTIWEEETKRYMHHYNMPAYSTGEARGAKSTNRREYGHGALAERALEPVLPAWRSSPTPSAWSLRCSAPTVSTSQGSICGSTLALMDAGVPIKAPVAGISCGLIQDDDGSFQTFIDIQGVEDFHGEMDFKVAGTKTGITAIQMDLKNDGLTMEIIQSALDITRDARCEIIDQVILPCIPAPGPR